MAVLQNAYSSSPEESDQEKGGSEISFNSAGINNSAGIRSGPGDLRDRHWDNSTTRVCRYYCNNFPLFDMGLCNV